MTKSDIIYNPCREVLPTSILDESVLAKKDFGYLYPLRWCVETFFSKVKGRLALENFTGQSVDSNYQDLNPQSLLAI